MIVPVCVPWLSEAVFSETFKVDGVDPEVGLRLIQGALVVAVKFAAPPVVEICTG